MGLQTFVRYYYTVLSVGSSFFSLCVFRIVFLLLLFFVCFPFYQIRSKRSTPPLPASILFDFRWCCAKPNIKRTYCLPLSYLFFSLGCPTFLMHSQQQQLQRHCATAFCSRSWNKIRQSKKFRFGSDEWNIHAHRENSKWMKRLQSVDIGTWYTAHSTWLLNFITMSLWVHSNKLHRFSNSLFLCAKSDEHKRMFDTNLINRVAIGHRTS